MLGLTTRATRALRRQDLGPIGRPTCHASGSAIAPPRCAGTRPSPYLVAGQVPVLVAELRFSDRVWGVPRLWCTSRDGNDDSEPRGRRSTCSTSRSWWQHATSRRAESITITRCEPEPISGIWLTFRDGNGPVSGAIMRGEEVAAGDSEGQVAISPHGGDGRRWPSLLSSLMRLRFAEALRYRGCG